MQHPDIELGSRAYEPSHVSAVTAAIIERFPDYFSKFASVPKKVRRAFRDALEEYETETDAYQAFLDIDGLDEYEDDPNSFRDACRKRCPIIRKCLHSNAEEMKEYQKKFNFTAPRDLLTVTRNIAEFGYAYDKTFDETVHEASTSVSDLKLGKLLEEGYTAFGVIGGGIKSHFLYRRYPYAFSNRSKEAIWALYFLTGTKDFGFRDGSEFLMYRLFENKNTIQQNYFYPYDLFAYYALIIYRLLRDGCAEKNIEFDTHYRYVYVDAFLGFVTERHQGTIDVLGGKEPNAYFH